MLLNQRWMDIKLFLRALIWLAAGLPALVVTSSAAGQDAVPFISVAPDPAYVSADAALAEYLRKAAKMTFSRSRPATYHNAIEEVVRHGDANSPYVARLTPYACVVAALQGAKFEILATYSSRATRALTYNSYFVVKADRADFSFSANPNLREITEFLSKAPRAFFYHDKFSTSSYFIPLHYFRTQGIFNLERGLHSDRLIPIEVSQLEPKGAGSTDLVHAVAKGITKDGKKVDIAAVWDGTMTKFADDPALRFIRLDAVLPNDLLVASTALSTQKIDDLRTAIQEMRCGELDFAGDFECWVDINDAPEAREALASLRRLAAAQPAPVTVRIALAARDGQAARDQVAYLEAARQAVRLAGTEFVLFDPDYHSWADLDWKLELIHDGALKLTSIVNGVDQKKVEPQIFRISFADAQEELTRRIVTVIHTRLNRIRYLWPFENRVPTVLRDVGFALPPGSRVTLQKITWLHPEKNEFARGDDFEAEVTLADFHKFQLDGESFPKLLNQDLDIDPMSNSAYRVILMRPTAEKPLFRYLTVALVVLFGLGGTAAAVDLYRARGTPKP
jgi:ABC-type phosphate/phosphonate transport system substrate-binding protein